MPVIKIRPPMASDANTLMVIDHSCMADFVWQMDYHCQEGQVAIGFNTVRLPRTVTVSYPRPVPRSKEDWIRQDSILVALVDDQVAGYARMNDKVVHATVWITDLAVGPRFRGQGAASALIQAVQAWALERHDTWMIAEMTTKNHAAICLVQKLGFEFCGYNDRYYSNQDIALFFGRGV